MDHPNENIPVAADAENDTAVRLAIESTPPGNPGPISREYAKQIRGDLLRRAGNPLAIGLTAKEVGSFEQDENTREREAPVLTATELRPFEQRSRGFGCDPRMTIDDLMLTKAVRLAFPEPILATIDAATARLRFEEEKKRMRDPNGIVAAAAAKLANVLPKGIRDKDRELQRRLVTAGIDAGIAWQYRAYGDDNDAWSKPCPASGPRPLWLPMIEYRLCPEAVERRIAETWTDYATRGIDAEEPYCRPTETSDWLWKVLLWCFMFLAAVIGGAYAWQFFLR